MIEDVILSLFWPVPRYRDTTEFIDEAKKANIRAQQLLKQRGSLLPEKNTSEATAQPV
jgi:hypothetical protein